MALGLSLEGAAREAGVAKGTWRKVEEGAPAFDSTLGRIETYFAWPVGTMLAILSGSFSEAEADALVRPATTPLVGDVPAVPVGTGVDPVDLSNLTTEDIEYIRSLAERLRQQRGG